MRQFVERSKTVADYGSNRICAILQKTFLFRGVAPQEADKNAPFLAECLCRQYTAGTTVQSAHAPVPGIAVLLSGQAEVLSSQSNTAIRLRFLEAGNIFGAATLYTENRQYETVIRAVTNCEILLLPEESVKRLIRNNEQIAENYIRFLSERICFLNQKVTAFTAGSAEAKLAVYLSGLSTDAEGKASLSMSLSALADSLGMGRASLYRALEKFEQSGFIAREGKHIRLLNPTALQNAYRHESNTHL